MYRFSAHSLTARITIAISLLAMLAIAGLTAFAVLAALKMDEAALHKQKVLVRSGLSALMAAVPREQESVAIWDDAVLHVAARDRSWLAKNFGGWMHRFFGHDRAYVMDTAGGLIFAAEAGKAVEPAAFADDEVDVRAVVARLRQQVLTRLDANGQLMPLPRNGLSSSDLREIGGRPAVVSARPILPHSDGAGVSEGSEYIFATVKFLDGAAMEELAHHALVPGLHYEPAGEAEPPAASTPFVTIDGHTLGHFVWNPDRPGITLAGQIAPGAGLALAVMLGVGFYLAQSLRSASMELQMSESRARHLAYHDVLTGLPNRALFEERLEAILDSVWRGTCEAALLFLDLDRFKEVNDTLGHRAGDELMCEAASRLRQVVGEAGTVARVGGDEFAVVLAAGNALDAARRMSERLLAALEVPFNLGADTVHVGLSIGVATAPAAAECRQELLRKADIALYAAKKRGRGRYQIFSEDMDDVVKQRRLVEADLRKALARGDELALEYQPLYSVEGALTGAEALLRWDHPVHKSISPAFLVTIAEESGLIRQIGEWVLHEACRMAARVPVPWVAVNVSPVQLRDSGFARRCLGIISAHGIEPHRIQVEITETVLIDNPEMASAGLRMLRAGGVRVALDDFGTGYASMSYLRSYPLDRLKIDRMFVQALCEGEEGRAIVAAMIDMARALKLKVTAEGVETASQRDLLRQMGCDEMQGFLFSRPVSAARFAQLFFPSLPGLKPQRRASGST